MTDSIQVVVSGLMLAGIAALLVSFGARSRTVRLFVNRTRTEGVISSPGAVLYFCFLYLGLGILILAMLFVHAQDGFRATNVYQLSIFLISPFLVPLLIIDALRMMKNPLKWREEVRAGIESVEREAWSWNADSSVIERAIVAAATFFGFFLLTAALALISAF